MYTANLNGRKNNGNETAVRHEMSWKKGDGDLDGRTVNKVELSPPTNFLVKMKNHNNAAVVVWE